MITRDNLHQSSPPIWLTWLFAILLTGCQEWGWHAPLVVKENVPPPFTFDLIYTPTPQDTAHLSTLGKGAEREVKNCKQPQDCEQAHFIRALSLLEENKALALQHFQKVAVSPIESPLVQSSRTWIWLLEETSQTGPRSRPRANLAQGLIQALLSKDLAMAQALRSPSKPRPEATALQRQTEYEAKVKLLTEQVQALAHEVTSIRNQSFAIQNLRKELDRRDKRVEELTLQLDALRRIDRELKQKSAPTQFPETISPVEDNHASTP